MPRVYVRLVLDLDPDLKEEWVKAAQAAGKPLKTWLIEMVAAGQAATETRPAGSRRTNVREED